MSELQTGVEHLIKVFHKYSGKEGDKYKLNKSELKNLLITELGMDVPAGVLRGLDVDSDGEVDFQEYVCMVAEMIMAHNDFFKYK